MLTILQQYDDVLSILLVEFQRIVFCKTTFNIKRFTITKLVKHINYRFAILIPEWDSSIAYIPILIKILIVIVTAFKFVPMRLVHRSWTVLRPATGYYHGMLLFLNPLINMICNKLLNSSKYNCDYNNDQLSKRF